MTNSHTHQGLAHMNVYIYLYETDKIIVRGHVVIAQYTHLSIVGAMTLASLCDARTLEVLRPEDFRTVLKS